jgi:hypothetical protein
LRLTPSTNEKGKIHVYNSKNRGFRGNHSQHRIHDHHECCFRQRAWRRLHTMRWQQLVACQMFARWLVMAPKQHVKKAYASQLDEFMVSAA